MLKKIFSFFDFKNIYKNLLINIGFWGSFKFFYLCIRTFINKKPLNEFEIIKVNNKNVAVSYNRGDVVSFLEIFNLKEYQPIFDLIPLNKFKPFCLIDLGANMGLTYIYFDQLNLIKKYIGVEPLEVNMKPLIFNTFSEYSKIYQKAVWINNQPVSFSDNGVNNCNKIDETGEKKVATITLKELFDEFKHEKEIMLKMDIEGAEYEIIQQDIKLIAEKSKYIAFEFHFISKNKYQECLKLIQKSYKISEILKEEHDLAIIFGINKNL